MKDKFQPEQSILTGRGLAHMQRDALLTETTGQVLGTTNGSASLMLEEQRAANTFPKVSPKGPQVLSGKTQRCRASFLFP